MFKRANKLIYLWSRPNLIWAIILTLAFLIRVWNLDLMPVGLSHDDELNDLITAKSLAMTGQHAPGRVNGIITQNDFCTGNCIYGEIVPYLLVPWLRVTPLDLFLSKLPFVIAGLGIVYCLGRLFQNLSGKASVGYLAALLVTINPWAIHFSRTAYENLFAYWFYLAMLALFTAKNLSFRKMIIATLVGFIGSLAYFGAKPIYLPLLIWGLTYAKFANHFTKLKQLFAIGLTGVVIFVIYFSLLANSHAGYRLTQLGTSSSSEISSLVNQQRQISLPIPIVRDLVINKYTIQIKLITEKLLEPLSPNYLFINGEPVNDHYQITNHAYLYLVDFPFIILGLMAISTFPIIALFLIGLIGIILLPGALSSSGNQVYTFRVGLLFPLLSGLSAWGMIWLYQLISIKRWFKISFILGLGLILAGSFAYFEIMYFYRTPFDKNSGAYFHKRALTKYLSLNLAQNPTRPIEILTSQPFDTFNTFVFFSGIYDQSTQIKHVNQIYASRDFRWQNLHFSADCNQLGAVGNGTTVILETGLNCEDLPLAGSLKIDNTRDGGQQYSIYNDQLCDTTSLQRYPYPQLLTDFKVEPMDRSQFCQKWISDPDNLTKRLP